MTTKAELLQAIRKKGLECCGGLVKEVRACKCKCNLKFFRFGNDPTPARTEGQKSNKNEKDIVGHGGVCG